MKTQEKAKKLVSGFMEFIGRHDRCITEKPDVEIAYKHSKELALICVDEILEDLEESLEVSEDLHPHAQGLIAGSMVNWQSVKKEIEKL